MRVYKSVLVVLAFLTFSILFPHNSEAYTKPNDVQGWEKLKWGMSSGEVQGVLGKDVKKREIRHDEKDGVYTELEMLNIKIGGSKFRASLWMDQDTKELSRIVFVPEVKTADYHWAKTFISLENSLVDRYGIPDVENTTNDPGTSAERIWNFPSTEIEMSYLKIDDSELLLLVFSERGNSPG